MIDRKVSQSIAGIHISGPNVHKTSVVIVHGDFAEDALELGRVYEKIGSLGRLFSDERLAEILRIEGPFSEVLVDCPLSVPPCVACTRASCPGVVQCEDVSVAYMLSISDKIQAGGSKKRKRTLNPQTQRLWDVLRLARGDEEHLEPSYSANMSPLVVRAKTLQRRLNALAAKVALKETSIHFSLKRLAPELGLSNMLHLEYKNFELGLERRREFVESLETKGWLLTQDPDSRALVIHSVETFQAFVAAFVGAMVRAGAYELEPRPYIEGESWVYIPSFE